MKYLTKRIVSAAGCLLLLTSAAFATDPGDYGPEAETDFETKQDAYSSGFEWGVEYSSDPSNNDNAYNQGYEEGYKEGYNYGSEDGHDETYDSAYQKGYEEGYRAGLSDDPSAPDNDIIDRSEVSSTPHIQEYTKEQNTKKSVSKASHIELYVVGGIVLLGLLLGFMSNRRK